MNDKLKKAPKLHLPPFNDWQGKLAGGIGGALEFDGVVMRYLPLEADMSALQKFCDSYLNLAPDFLVFKPVMPYVVMCVANYGSMGTSTKSLGWESQNEVLFGVPVEWWQLNPAGEMAFRNFGMVAPFIYVDSGASEAGGREVFGWPKCNCSFAEIADPWSNHPRTDRTLLSVHVGSFYGDSGIEGRELPELIRIDELPPVSLLGWPSPLLDQDSPLLVGVESMQRWVSIASHGLSNFAPRLFGGEGVEAFKGLRSFLGNMLHPQKGFVGAFHANTINLKQIRDAHNPNNACYQGYTNAQMEVKKIRGGGLIGESRMLQGDPSGGMSVYIRETEEQSIVTTLGLKVSTATKDGDTTVSTLKPVMPFWVEADMQYDNGETLCFRSANIPWRDKIWQLKTPPAPVPYDITGSIGYQVPPGPFGYQKATYRVLPLLASKDAMQQVLDDTFNKPLHESHPNDRFECYGDYVYAAAHYLNETAEATGSVSHWTSSGFELMIPVLFRQQGKPLSVGLVSPFMFSDSDVSVTSGRELDGWPTVMAHLIQPPNVWSTAAVQQTEIEPLLEIHTEAMREIGANQQFNMHRVVEILGGKLELLGTPAEQSIQADWASAIRDNVSALSQSSEETGHLEAYVHLAQYALQQGLPINLFSFKQIRDVEDFSQACYQSIVRSRLSVQNCSRLQEYDRPLLMKFDRFATLPIVESLGLKVAMEAGSYAFVIPQRPFFMEINMRMDSGAVLLQRIGNPKWVEEDVQDDSAVPSARAPGTADQKDLEAFERQLQALLRGNDPMTESLTSSSLSANTSPAKPVDIAKINEIVEKLQPQIAIHEILSTLRNLNNKTVNDGSSYPAFLVRTDSVAERDRSKFQSGQTRIIDGIAYWTPASGNYGKANDD